MPNLAQANELKISPIDFVLCFSRALDLLHPAVSRRIQAAGFSALLL